MNTDKHKNDKNQEGDQKKDHKKKKALVTICLKNNLQKVKKDRSHCSSDSDSYSSDDEHKKNDKK